MRIIKTFNNNVALVNDDGIEMIVIGLGIGFQKKLYDQVDIEKIEKKYILDASNLSKLEQLSNSNSMEYMELASIIFQAAQDTFDYAFNNQTLLAMLDHITYAMKRYKEGIVLPNLLLNEIECLYVDAFKFGKYALQIIYEETGVLLADDEVGYIAMHVINHGHELKNMSVMEIIHISKNLLDIIKQTYKPMEYADTYALHRILMHLKYLSQRVLARQQADSMSENNKQMYSMLIQQNPALSACLLAIHEYLWEEYEYALAPTEELYIMIHLMKFV